MERTKLECNCTKSTTQSVGIRSNLGRDLVGMYMLGEVEAELIPLGGVNVESPGIHLIPPPHYDEG